METSTAPLSFSLPLLSRTPHTESWVFMGRCGHTDPRTLRSGSGAPTPKSAAAPMTHPTLLNSTVRSSSLCCAALPPRAGCYGTSRARVTAGLQGLEVGSGLGWMSVMGSSWASMRVSALYICICVVLSLSHVLGTFPRGLCPRWGRTCGLSGIIQ